MTISISPINISKIALVSITLASCSGGDSGINPITNSAPTFSANSASINFIENSTDVVYTASATDAEGNTITYSLSGGVDQNQFSIATTSGELQFKNPPDHENPNDDGGNNVYEVEISASDSSASSSMTLTITVTDVAEETDSAYLPTDFTANAGNEQVTLNWTRYAESTVYNIYRSDNSNCDLTNINTCSNTSGQSKLLDNVSPPFIDDGLINDTTYYYWIEATHDGEVQLAGNYVSARPTGGSGGGNTEVEIVLIKGNGMINSQSSSMQQEEVGAYEEFTADLGYQLTVIDSPNVTEEVLSEADLIIYTNAGWAGSASQSTFDLIKNAYTNDNTPIYFMGDDLAHMIYSSRLNDVEDIILFNSTTNNGSSDTITAFSDHSIVRGVDDFSYYKDIDKATTYSDEVEVLAETSSGYPVLAVHENDNNVRIVSQITNLRASELIISDDDGLAQLETIYKSSVNWLLSEVEIVLIKGNGMLNSQSSSMQQEEVGAYEEFTADLGYQLTVIDSPNVTEEALSEADLIIYTNAGWASSASQSTFDLIKNAYTNDNTPIYFMGDDLAHMIYSSRLNDVEDIILFNSTTNNGSSDTITAFSDHSIVRGVDDFSYYKDIDKATTYSDEVEVLAETSSGYPVLAVHENDNNVRIVSQITNLRASELIISDDDGLAQLETIYKSSVNWLLSEVEIVLIKGNGMLNSQSSSMQQEEVGAYEEFTADLGYQLTVIDSPNVTEEALSEADLIIYTNAGWASSASQSTFDLIKNAYTNDNTPIYFMGDDLAHMIYSSRLNDVEDIILFNSTTNNGSSDTITAFSDHSIVRGVDDFSYYKDIDKATTYSDEVEVLAETSSGYPVLSVHENDNNVRIVSQITNLRASELIISDETGLTQLETIYKNSISWLLPNIFTE